MKDQVIPVVLAIFLLLSATANSIQYVSSSEKNDALGKLRDEVNLCNARLDQQRERRIDVSQLQNFIPINFNIETASSRKAILKDLLVDETLIYFFSYQDCVDCAINQIKSLSSLKRENPQLNLLVLMTYDNIRSLKILSQTTQDISIWGSKQRLPFPQQCYFVADKSGSASHFFIPETTDQALTQKYLNLTLTKLVGLKDSSL